MKSIYILFVFSLSILLISCNKDTVGINDEFQSNIQIQINIEEVNPGLPKPMNLTTITTVRVTVNGPGMSEINKNLSISGNQATGTLTIPKGENRHFLVEGLDNNIVLFSGETTKTLSNDKETVIINANWLSTQVELNAPIPSPNINLVTALITGDGISNPMEINMPIVGNTAIKNLNIPRGDKHIEVIASTVAGEVVFDLFSGQKNVKLNQDPAQVTVPLDPITEGEQQMAWHDGSFEETRYSTVTGNILAAGFDVSGMGPVYIKSISMHLTWQGYSGDYRIVILDDFDLGLGLRFRSAPLPPENDGWVNWNLNWDPPENGRFDNIVIAGIEYASPNGWPEVGFDVTNPSESSFYYDSSQSSWFAMSDGDFGITVTVQTAVGTTKNLKPTVIIANNIQTGQISFRQK